MSHTPSLPSSSFITSSNPKYVRNFNLLFNIFQSRPATNAVPQEQQPNHEELSENH